MKIFGEHYKRDEILKRVGDISQICDIKSFEYNDGVSKGIRAIGIKSISGLDLQINTSIFQAKVRESFPTYFESKGFELLRTFNAGFLTTGGLSNIGCHVWKMMKNLVSMEGYLIHLRKG